MIVKMRRLSNEFKSNPIQSLILIVLIVISAQLFMLNSKVGVGGSNYDSLIKLNKAREERSSDYQGSTGLFLLMEKEIGNLSFDLDSIKQILEDINSKTEPPPY